MQTVVAGIVSVAGSVMLAAILVKALRSSVPGGQADRPDVMDMQGWWASVATGIALGAGIFAWLAASRGLQLPVWAAGVTALAAGIACKAGLMLAGRRFARRREGG